MSEFSFQTVPSLKFGEPAADALAPMVASFGARRLMLVTDPGVQGAGLVEPVVSALEASGLTVAVYDDVAADPPETKVLAAVEAADPSAPRPLSVLAVTLWIRPSSLLVGPNSR